MVVLDVLTVLNVLQCAPLCSGSGNSTPPPLMQRTRFELNAR